MSSLTIYRNELRNDLFWHLTWILSIIGLLFLTILIYPGDEAMKDFMPLLQMDLFEAFIGSIGGASPNYTLWIAILIPMMVVVYFLYAVTTGVRIVTYEVSNNTGELMYTLPVSRSKNLTVKIISSLTFFALFFILQFIIFGVNITGYSIELDKLSTITWWGMLFFFSCLGIGMILGLIAGNYGRGMQYSFLFVLFLYAIQILGRLQPDYADINNFNPLNFYQPEIVLLTNTMKEGFTFEISYPVFPLYALLLGMIVVSLSFYEFNRKDLSDDAGFHVSFFKNLHHQYRVIAFITTIWRKIKSLIVPKKIKNNPFVFWVRLFEKKFPITADFIYSDNMTLFIAFLAIVTIFPFQLALYPGDKIIGESIVGFAGNPFFLFITYGIDVTYNPYLWFVITQALGVFWMIMMPICFYWVYKALIKESSSITGEIIGGLPIKSSTVVFQRLLAIFFELIYLIFWMIIFVIISESLTGSSYNLEWEIISLLASLPFYMFLIVLMFEINLISKSKGRLISGLFLVSIVLLFFISIVNDDFNVWYIRGIFSLYNPVLILTSESLNVANYGFYLLTLAVVILIFPLLKLSKRFTWVSIYDKSSENDLKKEKIIH